MAGEPLPPERQAQVEQLAREEERVVIRVTPHSTFATPPRHVNQMEDMDSLATGSAPPSPGSRRGSGAGSHASIRPRDQQRPMASACRADWRSSARPMMLWPEARRSPSVGIAGATPTPSADTHATARPAAASSRRCRNRSGSSGKPDSAHVVMCASVRALPTATAQQEHGGGGPGGDDRQQDQQHRPAGHG